MTVCKMLLAVSLLAPAPAIASISAQDDPIAAPAGTEATRYCMKIEAITGSRVEKTVCWTRAEWADQGVDVDKEWAKEGVRVEG